jgi:F0F1-type ATP synthase assembly protein I
MPDRKILDKNQKGLNNYAKYSGVGFQMIIIILAGTFGGIKLDKVVSLKFPLFSVLFSLLSVILAMYIVIREFISKDKNE